MSPVPASKPQAVMSEIFESAVRSIGDLAGVFEFDGVTSYFYLYRVDENEEEKILDAIKISVDAPDYTDADVEIQWFDNERLVCLKIREEIWAAFDCDSSQKFGGDYIAGTSPHLPPEILARL
jgi:hypothetical protein